MIAENLKALFGLFFPSICPVCGELMSEDSALMCTKCMLEIPLTGYWQQVDNPTSELFWGHIPVVNACSFMLYSAGGRFNNLIHDFKYRGRWRSARRFGVWFGSHLRESGLYSDIDVVIAVPLHIRKELKRGYNQSNYIAEGIAEALGCPTDFKSVRRAKNNSSQTSRNKTERWENVDNIFTVRRPEALAGKHILLIDDVLTTGATIISCGESIVRTVPDSRLSIATLATTATPV